jgi:3-mercaptopyruvate sulfurtransferase SseA
MARLLTGKGYRDVRPLLGGFDAWLEGGYPVERHGAAGVDWVPSAARQAAP